MSSSVRRPRILLAIPLFLAIAAAPLEAQQSLPPSPAVSHPDAQHDRDRFRYDGPALTLDQALADARANNPDLAALRTAIEVTRARPAQAQALKPPTLETTVWQWPVNSINPLDTNMYMFMVSQELPGRGKRGLRAAAASKEIDLAENDVVAKEREVEGAVREAYAELAGTRQAIAIHLDTVDLLRQLADVAEAKYAATRISQQDVLKPVVELSRLHSDLITLDQQDQTTTIALNALLGRPLDTPIGPVADPTDRVIVVSLEDLQQRASSQQPSLRDAHLAVEQAEASLAAARQDSKPDFTIQGGYMLLPHQTDGILARFAMTWPNAPWSRGGLDAHVRELAAAVDTAKARQRAAETMVQVTVRQAYVRVKSAEEQVALLRTTILPQARQALDVSRVAYEIDRVDLLSVLDNERTLLQTNVDYSRALVDDEQAIAALERAVGADLSLSEVHLISAKEK